MSKNQSKTKFSRRSMLAITGVSSIAALGCGLGPKTVAAENKAESFEDNGHRLYLFPSHKDPYLQLERGDLPAPIFVYLGLRDANAKSNCFIWATKKQVAEIEATRKAVADDVKPLVEKTTKDVAEYGSADEAKGFVNVLFAPNIQEQYQAGEKGEAGERNYATTAHIAASWKKQFGDKIEVTVLEKSPTPKDGRMARLTMPGQVQIRFEGKLSPEILKSIKQHPQAVRIQWGEKPFTSLYCPPCGMG